MSRLLTFPGDSYCSHVLTFLIMAAFWMAGFALVLRLIIFWIPAHSQGNRLIGHVIGFFLSIFVARGYANVFISVFHPRDELTTTVVLLLGALINFCFVHKMYGEPQAGGP